MDGDYLAQSFHHFEQEGRTASFNACNNAEYMKWMGYDLHDIVAVFSLWDMGCDETWLDGCTGCGGCFHDAVRPTCCMAACKHPGESSILCWGMSSECRPYGFAPMRPRRGWFSGA